MEFQDIAMDSGARIKVFGVGGGGGNAVNNMIRGELKGVTCYAANTDAQILSKSLAEHKIQLGEQLTRGLGAGGKPEVGRESAVESLEAINLALDDTDMVFITAGMGGGTGTGAAPIIAQAAKERGILTVGVVTKPFAFEGKRRLDSAMQGIAEMSKHVDSLITIANDRLVALAAKKASFADMLLRADEVLYYAVKGISDLFMIPGIINLDFADLKTVMRESGIALMGAGAAVGENRAEEAAMRAITSPLLEDVSIDGAHSVLWNITCGPDLGMDEVSQVASIIQDATDPEARIIFGTALDENMGDALSVTVIATGIDTATRNNTISPLDALRATAQITRKARNDAAQMQAAVSSPESTAHANANGVSDAATNFEANTEAAMHQENNVPPLRPRTNYDPAQFAGKERTPYYTGEDRNIPAYLRKLKEQNSAGNEHSNDVDPLSYLRK